jgi:hypothetical protein
MGVASWLRYPSGNSDQQNKALASQRLLVVREYIKAKLKTVAPDLDDNTLNSYFVCRYHHYDTPVS